MARSSSSRQGMHSKSAPEGPLVQLHARIAWVVNRNGPAFAGQWPLAGPGRRLARHHTEAWGALVRRERRLRGGQSRSLPCEQPVRLEDRALPGVRVSQEHGVRQMRSQYEFATGFISSQMPFTTNDPRSVRLKPAPNRELLPSRPRPPPAHPSLCSCRSRERHHACRRRLLSLSGCGKRVCLRVRERGIILRGFRAALCNAIT